MNPDFTAINAAFKHLGWNMTPVHMLKARLTDLERDLASSQAAALLLHKRMEELERELRVMTAVAEANGADYREAKRKAEHGKASDRAARTWRERAEAAEAQLAERDKRIEGLREALEKIAYHDGIPTTGAYGERQGPEVDMRTIARNTLDALADPVVVPGWDDGTWNQEC